MEAEKKEGGLMEYDPESKQMITEEPEPVPEFKENSKVFGWLVFSITLTMLIALFFFVWNILSLTISRQSGQGSINFSSEGLVAAFSIIGKAAIYVVPLIFILGVIYFYTHRKRS